MPSPFVFQHPLPPDQLRGRDREISEVVEAASAGEPLTVTAPRRYGKTSVLLAARAQLTAADHAVVLVDLYATASLTELVVRLERAWAATTPTWRRIADRIVSAGQLGLSLTGAGIGVVFQRQPRSDPLPALHALLDLPRRIDADRRVVVILDEFQSIGDLAGAEGLLRSHLQHHRDVAGYVFAGSEAHLLHRQFDDPDRPFFGQASRLRLGRPPRVALQDVIERGFGQTERHPGAALGPLLDFADDHPQRAMLLAHQLWRFTPDGEVADLEAWERALTDARVHTDGEVQARYDRATRNQQRVVRAIAHGTSPFSVAAQAPLGLERGSVSAAVDQAIRETLIEPRHDPVGSGASAASYRVVDPLLADWIRRRFPL